jgi:hypothetical protein
MTANCRLPVLLSALPFIGLSLGLAAAVPASTGSAVRRGTAENQLPLRTRDVAIFQGAFSGVPRATCVRRTYVVVCGDRATYHVAMKRVQRCLVKVESGRYGALPTRTRWIEGC